MSLFPRAFTNDFAPVFRLLDDYASTVGPRGSRDFFGPAFTQAQQRLQTFQPKFDVKENNDSYELHGELPGVEQKDLSIEFTDADTISIRGRTESVREEGTPPAGFIEGQESAKQIEGGKAKQPTVEDENAANDETAVQAQGPQEIGEANKPQSTYWVSERSVGSFSRSFSFPQRVDQDAVKASLKNGILSIVVPKAAGKINKKIVVE